jgi:hypothetical protein
MIKLIGVAGASKIRLFCSSYHAHRPNATKEQRTVRRAAAHQSASPSRRRVVRAPELDPRFDSAVACPALVLHGRDDARARSKRRASSWRPRSPPRSFQPLNNSMYPLAEVRSRSSARSRDRLSSSRRLAFRRGGLPELNPRRRQILELIGARGERARSRPTSSSPRRRFEQHHRHFET